MNFGKKWEKPGNIKNDVAPYNYNPVFALGKYTETISYNFQ